MERYLDRRALLKIAGGTAVAGGAAVGLRFVTRPAVAVEGLTAEDVQVDTADGEIEEVTIAPTITVAWTTDTRVNEIWGRFRADGPRASGTAIGWKTRRVAPPTTEGAVEFDLDPHPLLDKNGGPLDASSFEPQDRREETSERVTAFFDVRLLAPGRNVVAERQPLDTVAFTLTVSRVDGATDVTGRLDTE
ncbi:MAG: hypothetical protein PPP58_01220 [Natronomonas sp.]